MSIHWANKTPTIPQSPFEEQDFARKDHIGLFIWRRPAFNLSYLLS